MKIGKIDLTALKEQFGTPLYIYDEQSIRNKCQVFKNNFLSKKISTEVLYASKAFLTIAMAQLIKQEDLGLDVVSQGELYTALKAGFDPKRIVLHGNNKTIEELVYALNHDVGIIVLDNHYEAELLMSIIDDMNVSVMLRVNPGIDAHTHDYIKTSTLDSKFGVSIEDEKTIELIKRLVEHPNINFLGTHSHIGSQILASNSFYQHIETMLLFYKKLKDEHDVDLENINLGGGFGIKYLETDEELDLETTLKQMISLIEERSQTYGLHINKVFIEPGRSIVGDAGYTLYTVNQIKETLNEKKYIFIDGSMNDHLRTALYQAKYDAEVITKNKDTSIYTVAGKACESGDIIIKDIMLKKPNVNDLLLVKSTGAYHYSMASHYNRLFIPPVVFIDGERVKVVVRKESLDDLISHDEELN